MIERARLEPERAEFVEAAWPRPAEEPFQYGRDEARRPARNEKETRQGADGAHRPSHRPAHGKEIERQRAEPDEEGRIENPVGLAPRRERGEEGALFRRPLRQGAGDRRIEQQCKQQKGDKPDDCQHRPATPVESGHRPLLPHLFAHIAP